MSKGEKTPEIACKQEKYKYGLTGKNWFFIIIIGLLLSSIICIFALEKQSCFEMHILEIRIKAGLCN